MPLKRVKQMAMQILRGLSCVLLAIACVQFARAEQPDADESIMVVVDEGKTYRLANGEPITGKDVIDLVLEQCWDKELQVFIEHALKAQEAVEKKIVVADAEVDSELQNMLLKLEKHNHGMNPDELTLAKLEEKYGKSGALAALRLETRDDVGLLRVLQKDAKLPANLHIADKQYREAARQYLEKLISQKGILSDPKDLAGGEAVRIGGRGYPRDEVRQFIITRVGQISKAQLKHNLDILTLEHLAEHSMKDQKIELGKDDMTFHFSYQCRKREAETGAPGRAVFRQDLEKNGMTPEQYLQSRVCKCDAIITRLAKEPIRYAQLKAEFDAHPERYKRNENMIAHVFLCVRDSDGRPYTSNWEAPGHESLNNFVRQQRERQFISAKPKIDGLLHLAKEDFLATVRNYSDDKVGAANGGKIGRIGAETILMPPCDQAVRAASLKLKPGEISEPVRSDFGWHILKCLEQQEVTFEEAEERIYINLIAEARKNIDDSLEKGVKILDKF